MSDFLDDQLSKRDEFLELEMQENQEFEDMMAARRDDFLDQEELGSEEEIEKGLIQWPQI